MKIEPKIEFKPVWKVNFLLILTECDCVAPFQITDKFLLKYPQMTSRCWQVARVAGISVTPEDFQKLFRMPSMVILNYPPQLSTENKTILTQLQVWWLMTTSCFFCPQPCIASKNILFFPFFPIYSFLLDRIHAVLFKAITKLSLNQSKWNWVC